MKYTRIEGMSIDRYCARRLKTAWDLHSTSLTGLLFSCPFVGVSANQTLPCFPAEDWWTPRTFRLHEKRLRIRTKDCRMRISGGKKVRLVKVMM